MRCVVQRVSSASVTVNGTVSGQVDAGLMVLIGISVDDTEADLKYMAEKVPNLRIFDDENGVMNRSVLDVGGNILAVSQFTLYGDARGGRRPSYIRAASIQSSGKTRISTLRLTLDVHSREEMDRVINALRNKSDILDVYRTTT